MQLIAKQLGPPICPVTFGGFRYNSRSGFTRGQHERIKRSPPEICMTLFPSDPHEENNQEFVQVEETHIGKGVFAVRSYPATAVIGKITGDLIFDEQYGSNYSFEYDDGVQLEPNAPFRFLNHSCEPNCEFDLLDEPKQDGESLHDGHLHVVALRDIAPGEELTIEYNWPATSAIICQCGTPSCRGWVVADEELDYLVDPESCIG